MKPSALNEDRVVMLGPREELEQPLGAALGFVGTAQVFPPGEAPDWSDYLAHSAPGGGSDLAHLAAARERQEAAVTLVAWRPGSLEIDVGTLRVTVPSGGAPQPEGTPIAYVHVSVLAADPSARLETWVLGRDYTSAPPPGTQALPRRVVLGPLLPAERDQLYSQPLGPTVQEFHDLATGWLVSGTTTVLVVVRPL